PRAFPCAGAEDVGQAADALSRLSHPLRDGGHAGAPGADRERRVGPPGRRAAQLQGSLPRGHRAAGGGGGGAAPVRRPCLPRARQPCAQGPRLLVRGAGPRAVPLGSAERGGRAAPGRNALLSPIEQRPSAATSASPWFGGLSPIEQRPGAATSASP